MDRRCSCSLHCLATDDVLILVDFHDLPVDKARERVAMRIIWNVHRAAGFRRLMTCSQGERHTELLRAALSLVLKDEGFSLPTAPAEKARKSAESLMEIMEL